MRHKFTRKLVALLTVASMIAALCCACGASSSDDAAMESGEVSVTTEETNVSDETGDISAEEESSTDEVGEVLGEYSAGDLGITDEDMQKIYAVVAYELSTRGLDATYLKDMYVYHIIYYSITEYSAGVKSDSLDLGYLNTYAISNEVSNDSVENIISRDIYYIFSASSYDYSSDEATSTFISADSQQCQFLIETNVTFSEDQIATGEQIVSKLPIVTN